jgi:hypothetical protein
MINLKKKLFVIFLACFIIILTAAGCGDDGALQDGVPESTAESETAEEEYNPRAHAQDNLPDGLNFGGRTIRIMHHEEDVWGWEMEVEELTGDIVHDAIYRRNRLVEERLNVSIKMLPHGGIYTNPLEFFNVIRRSVSAGNDDIDLIAAYGFITTSLGMEGFYLNWHNVDYIDLRQPWWSADFEEQMTFDGKLYFIVGDIGITLLSRMFCMYFNKDLAEAYEVGNLYQLVIDGGWTLEKMSELSRDIYTDLNGNGIADNEDLYGCAIATGNLVDAMYAAFDFRITEKDSEGIPQLTMNTPKMVDMVETVYDFLYNNIGTHAEREEGGNPGAIFMDNRALFMPSIVEANEDFRAIDVNYGILPYPKWNKEQEAYRTSVQLALSFFSIPITCREPDEIAAVAEALCVESYRNVTPAYFEIAQKQKYSRDEESSHMLDIIREGLFFDFGFMNSFSMEGYHNIFRDLMSNRRTDFASAYERNERRYQRALDRLLEAYTNNP